MSTLPSPSQREMVVAFFCAALLAIVCGSAGIVVLATRPSGPTDAEIREVEAIKSASDEHARRAEEIDHRIKSGGRVTREDIEFFFGPK